MERRVGEIFEGVDTSRLSVTCILSALFCFSFSKLDARFSGNR